MKEDAKNHLLSKLPFSIWAGYWTYKLCRHWKKYNEGAILINMSDRATINGSLRVKYANGVESNFYVVVKPDGITHYFEDEDERGKTD